MSAKLVQSLKQYRFDEEHQRWQFVFPKSPKRKGQCQVIHCRRFARVQVRWDNQKLRTVHHGTCDTCRSRLYRANNPAKEALRVIRDRALRRGQVFNLTLGQFLAVPRIAEYLQHRGRGIDDLHLDRVKVERGYVPGNLQVLTTAENLRKQREVDYAPF